jgi:hypothetical protein
MNWLKKALTFSVLAFWALACGVKGDPLPPEKPADLGRGRPTYKRATEKIQIESQRPGDAKPEPKVKEEDDDDGD